MYVPKAQLAAALAIQNLDKFLVQIEGLQKPILGGIAVYGPAAGYALVWEYGAHEDKYGNPRLLKPGPRTVWGTNPKGERAILSSQAPEGYVAIHEQEFWPIITEELEKVNFKANSATELEMRLEVAVDNACQRIAKIVSDSAPIGETGDLRAGIQLADSSVVDLGDLAKSEGSMNLFF